MRVYVMKISSLHEGHYKCFSKTDIYAELIEKTASFNSFRGITRSLEDFHFPNGTNCVFLWCFFFVEMVHQCKFWKSFGLFQRLKNSKHRSTMWEHRSITGKFVKWLGLTQNENGACKVNVLSITNEFISTPRCNR